MSGKLLEILNKIDSIIDILDSEVVSNDDERKNDSYNSNYYIELSGRISALAVALEYLTILKDETSILLSEFLEDCVSTDTGAQIALLQGEIELLRAQLKLAEKEKVKKTKIKNKKSA